MNRRVPLFRAARDGPVGRQVIKTAMQVAIFWGVFLGAIPLVLVRLERWWGLPDFQGAIAPWLGWGVFGVAGGLGLWSGLTMSVAGRGTPLPMDCPRALVVTGPYAYVRNPMAIAGLTQGAAVGLMLGSFAVLAYVAAGAVAWNWFVRPLEERDLRERFGPQYSAYCRCVPCWRWNARRYRSEFE